MGNRKPGNRRVRGRFRVVAPVKVSVDGTRKIAVKGIVWDRIKYRAMQLNISPSKLAGQLLKEKAADLPDPERSYNTNRWVRYIETEEI